MPNKQIEQRDSSGALDGRKKMEIIGKVDSDEKRLQMPGTFVMMKCPKCGEEYELEMVDQIMYPGSSEPHCFYGECEIENGGCENHWEVPYHVEVFAKIII